MRRLKTDAGETIVETLVAVLIVTLSMLFLAGAVTSSARTNTAIDNSDTAFDVSKSEEVGEGTVTLTTMGIDPAKPAPLSFDVTVYEIEENEYYYYE